MKFLNKYAPSYKPVGHYTEQERRERYQGCASRQNLRAELRKQIFAELREKEPKALHADLRERARSLAKEEYRRWMKS